MKNGDRNNVFSWEIWKIVRWSDLRPGWNYTLKAYNWVIKIRVLRKVLANNFASSDAAKNNQLFMFKHGKKFSFTLERYNNTWTVYKKSLTCGEGAAHLRIFLFNRNSLHARLNSHYKAWSYKKRSTKKITGYGKSV